MKKDRDYHWYVEPLDEDTNRIIGEKLFEDVILEGVRCSDGSRRNLWCCNRDLIAMLKRSKGQLNLKFNIYVQEGRNGGIRPSNID